MKTMKRLLALPSRENEIERQTAQVLQSILILFGFISLTYAILSSLADLQNWVRYTAQGGVLLLCMLLGLFYLRRGYLRTVAVLEILVIWLVFTVAAYTGGGVRSSGYFGYLVVLVVAGVVSGKRLDTMVVALLCAGVGYYLVLAEQNGTLPPSRVPMTSFALWLDSLVYFSVIFVLVFLTMRITQNAFLRLDRELTERRRAEERFRRLFENSPDLVLEMDNSGKILLANRYPKEYEGRQFCQFVAPAYHELIREGIAESLGTGRVVSMELHSYQFDGSPYWSSVRMFPLSDPARTDILSVIVIDINEQKEATEKIYRLNEDLQQEVAELERLTYTVSHELKNPIVTIKGFLGSVERDVENRNYERALKDIKRVSTATDKMYETLSDLLELSRIGRIFNPSEEIDLVLLVREALETLHGRIQSLNVTVHVSPDLPTVYGDRIRLREVYENLIDNAAKYSRDQPAPHIEIGVRQDRGEKVMFVRDNGMGIDPKYHAKVFGLFEKLDAQSEGTGIGLALIKRIIETHGGRIWVESEGIGKGSTFCFTIPVPRT